MKSARIVLVLALTPGCYFLGKDLTRGDGVDADGSGGASGGSGGDDSGGASPAGGQGGSGAVGGVGGQGGFGGIGRVPDDVQWFVAATGTDGGTAALRDVLGDNAPVRLLLMADASASVISFPSERELGIVADGKDGVIVDVASNGDPSIWATLGGLQAQELGAGALLPGNALAVGGHASSLSGACTFASQTQNRDGFAALIEPNGTCNVQRVCGDQINVEDCFVNAAFLGSQDRMHTGGSQTRLNGSEEGFVSVGVAGEDVSYTNHFIVDKEGNIGTGVAKVSGLAPTADEKIFVVGEFTGQDLEPAGTSQAPPIEGHSLSSIPSPFVLVGNPDSNNGWLGFAITATSVRPPRVVSRGDDAFVLSRVASNRTQLCGIMPTSDDQNLVLRYDVMQACSPMLVAPAQTGLGSVELFDLVSLSEGDLLLAGACTGSLTLKTVSATCRDDGAQDLIVVQLATATNAVVDAWVVPFGATNVDDVHITASTASEAVLGVTYRDSLAWLDSDGLSAIALKVSLPASR